MTIMAMLRTQIQSLWARALVVLLLLLFLGSPGDNAYGALPTKDDFRASTLVVVAFEGMPIVRKKGLDSWVEIHVGMHLCSGDRLHTDNMGQVKLRGNSGETILVESNTKLEIGDSLISSRRGRTVRLTRGTVWVEIKRIARAAREMFRFSIITPTAFAGVRGTAFSVSVGEDLATEVTVFDGIVEVTAAWTTVQVSAGYTTKVEPNRGPEPPKKQNEDQGKAWDKKRLWFEAKPGKMPPPFEENWQPPGLVGKEPPGLAEKEPPGLMGKEDGLEKPNAENGSNSSTEGKPPRKSPPGKGKPKGGPKQDAQGQPKHPNKSKNGKGENDDG